MILMESGTCEIQTLSMFFYTCSTHNWILSPKCLEIHTAYMRCTKMRHSMYINVQAFHVSVGVTAPCGADCWLTFCKVHFLGKQTTVLMKHRNKIHQNLFCTEYRWTQMIVGCESAGKENSHLSCPPGLVLRADEQFRSPDKTWAAVRHSLLVSSPSALHSHSLEVWTVCFLPLTFFASNKKLKP